MNYRHAESFIGLMALIVVVGAAQAENRTWPATVVSLEGDDWKVAADPKNAGREEAWWKGPMAGARLARVPGIMQEALPGYHGVAWYWREFVAPEKSYADGRCPLRFDGVDYRTGVGKRHACGRPRGRRDAVHAGYHRRSKAGPDEPAGGAGVEPDGAGNRRHRAGGNTAPEQGRNGIGVGGSYNSGGIMEPVKVFWVPAARIDECMYGRIGKAARCACK